MQTFKIKFTEVSMFGSAERTIEVKAKTPESAWKKFWAIAGNRTFENPQFV